MTDIAETITAANDRPPSDRLPPAEWAKKNLFSTPVSGIVTVVFGLGAIYAIVSALNWAFFGTEWEIIEVNLRLFMIGQFPTDELWRPWVAGFFLVSALGLGGGLGAAQSHDEAIASGVEPTHSSLLSLFRRFWPLLALLIFFLSFVRTWKPWALTALVLAFLVAARLAGRHLPAALRRYGWLVTAYLGIGHMIVLAGFSGLAGLVLGLVTAAFLWRELDFREFGQGTTGSIIRIAISAGVGIAVWVIIKSIDWGGFGWDEWGGFHLTLFVTVAGVVLGFPFGLLLAMGRKSKLPFLRVASVIFIEFVRGVPLISLLFFSNFMLKLFFPVDIENIPGGLTRAIIVITGFSAAYIAEIVRGGLQAVPKGQVEAAQAVGMSGSAIQRLIVLPQALRAVIPAMVGQFIALFKDTSLLAVISLLDFLRVTDLVNVQPDFVGKGLALNTYVFVAIGYWAVAYTMSRESRRIEQRLAVANV